MLTIYGDLRSGNCLKVKWAAELTGTPYQWRDVLYGTPDTSAPAFLAVNPAAQVPAVAFADGRTMAQSNAIVLHLAQGTPLWPDDPWDRAKAWEWMFWEQYSHEPLIAVRRALKLFKGLGDDEIAPELLPKGQRALMLMEGWLGRTPWFSGARFGMADIALVAYTRLSEEGGFDLAPTPAVRAWIARCEHVLGL